MKENLQLFTQIGILINTPFTLILKYTFSKTPPSLCIYIVHSQLSNDFMEPYIT